MITVVCRQCRVKPVKGSCPRCGHTMNERILTKMHNDEINGVPRNLRDTPFIYIDEGRNV